MSTDGLTDGRMDGRTNQLLYSPSTNVGGQKCRLLQFLFGALRVNHEIVC